MRKFLISLQFLTRFPVKLTNPPSVEEIGESIVHFPLAGLCLGLYLVILNHFLSWFLPPIIVNTLLVIGLCLATGAMHLDGLADTVDGFYAGNSLPLGPERKARILAVMKDSQVGVMGALAVFFILTLKIVGLNSLTPHIKTSALLVAPMLSRWYIVWAAAFSNYAKPSKDGLGKTFTLSASSDQLTMASIAPAVLSLLLLGFNGLIIIVLSAFIVHCLIKYIKSKIDGMTGDTFGALTETAETIIIILVVALTS